MKIWYDGKEFVNLGFNPYEMIGTSPNVKRGDRLLDEDGNMRTTQVNYPEYWNQKGIIQEIKCKAYAKVYVSERGEYGYIPLTILGGYKTILSHLHSLYRLFSGKAVWA